jgi:hypothetical protein
MDKIQVTLPDDTSLVDGKKWKINTKVQRDGKPYRYVHTSKGYRIQTLDRAVAARMIAPKRLTRNIHVAFKDGDVLNCTRNNLVITDRYKNPWYRRATQRHKTSRFKWVYWDKSRNKWHSKFAYPVVDPLTHRMKYKVKHLGDYPIDQEVQAAKAADAYAHAYNPNIKLNFPNDYAQEEQKIG